MSNELSELNEEVKETELVPSPTRLALLINNEVLDILGLPDRLAAILLSNPTIIDVTDFSGISVGDIYNPNKEEFTRVIAATKLIKEEGFNE